MKTTPDGVALDSSQERPAWPGAGDCGLCALRIAHRPAECGKYAEAAE
jgi:hypothetical protein